MESVTALYAGLTGVLFAVISLNVSHMRHKLPAAGEASHPDLHRAIRAQANCAEYIAWLFLLLFLAELLGGSSRVLHMLGGTMLAGRVLHAAGMLGKLGPAQSLGATLNYICLFAVSGYVLYLRFQ